MEDAERLIVYIDARFQQFEKELKRAERSGTWTYQKLVDGSAKASTAMEKRMTATAQAMGRSLDSIFGRDLSTVTQREFNQMSREFLASKDALDRLRSSVDPAFAATLRYEQAVKELNDALQRGIITETQHRQVLDQVSAAYLKSGQAAGAHSGALGALGTMSDATKAKLQNAGYQVQDVAVQMMAGTDGARALAMQLPQLLGGFGLLGVALGTLASVGLPLLASWFGQAEGKAKDFSTAMGDVQNSLSAMNEAAAIYTTEGLIALKEKYGELNAELRAFIALQTEAVQIKAIQDTAAAMQALYDGMNSWTAAWSGDLEAVLGNLQSEFNVTRDEALGLYNALLLAKNAKTFEEQLSAVTLLRERLVEAGAKQTAFYLEVLKSEDALRQLVAVQPKQGWLQYAIGQAETLAGKLWNAVSANAALSNGPGQTKGNLDWAKTDLGFTKPGEDLIYTPPKTGTGGTGGGGGGGGGGRSERSGKIDALVADLQTEREVITAWHEESLALVNGATEAELAAIGGRHEALERLEAEHQERLRGIKEEAQGGFLAQADQFFGGMAALTKAGGDKMLKVHRVTAAAQGVINSYTAFTEVLRDPSFIGRPWARFGAAAAALSSGLSAVASIKSGGGSASAGGGGGGGASAAAGTSGGDSGGASTTPLRASIEPLDPGALYQGAAVRKLLDGLMEEAGNRGLILGWRA